MKVLYFAWVREKVGSAEESVALPGDVTTVAELLRWLGGRGGGHGEALKDPSRVRVAVNQEVAGPAAPVTDADEVALFPPVTGGRA